MPRVIHCIVLADLGRRLRPRLNLPQRAMFVHGRYNEEGAILFNVGLGKLGFDINRIRIVIFEVAL